MEIVVIKIALCLLLRAPTSEAILVFYFESLEQVAACSRGLGPNTERYLFIYLLFPLSCPRDVRTLV